MSYSPALPPMEHQTRALAACWAKPTRPSNQEVFAYLMDMGTGKTKVALDEFGMWEHEGEIRDLLVVAPAGSYRNWFQDAGPDDPCELRKHLCPDLHRRLVWGEWRSGAGRGSDSRRRLDALFRVRDLRRPRALMVNIEALSRVEKAQEVVRAFLEDSLPRGGAMMVVDESTRIKGDGSLRTKFLLDVAPFAAARRLLSGLVAPHSPLDLYSQFHLLDWRILGSRSIWGFRNRFAVQVRMQRGGHWERGSDGDLRKTGGHQFRRIVGFRNVEDVHALIAPYSFRVLKSECLDLPPKVYSPIRYVQLTAEQRRVYGELLEFGLSRLRESATYVRATMVLALRQKLDQVTCGFVRDDDGAVRWLPEERSRALMEVLEECSGKVIIWTSHDPCVRALHALITEEYGKGSCAQYWGGNAATRHEDERRFKTDPSCRFLVGTPASGGVGNNWQHATTQVFYNNSDNLEHRMQGEDRTHRKGLVGAACYVDIAAEGTTDLKKIQGLRKKIDLAAAVTGDDYVEWLI